MSKFNPHALGLFWQDLPVAAGKKNRTRGPMPAIPHTGWLPPTEFPNLSAATVMGVDTETFDPELTTAGPGWARGKGHIIGISLAVQDGTSWYFPMRHESQPELNMDPEQVMRFMQYALTTTVPKVGTNLIYDIGWLKQEGIKVGGKLHDIQFAAALLNSETPDVSLEGLAQHYLGVGKTTSILYDWLASWLGGVANERQRKHMYLSPPSLAGPYAEADASLPIAILEKQWPEMIARGVLDLYDLECRLINLLVEMRFKGAPVNLNTAEENYAALGSQLIAVEDKIRHIAGQPVNPNAGDSIKAAFNKLSIPVPMVLDKKTGQMKQSFTAATLGAIDHPLTDELIEYRQIAKVRNTFVKGYIIDKHVNGRVHCTFHPLKGADSGARSGRFASSDPNLQNIPIRTEIGKMVRRIFEATQGKLWKKYDYSQIEYRLLAHHAVGQGAYEIRQAFINDPLIDYHELVGSLILRLTGIDLERRNIKTINFGLIYGMSQPELARRLKLSGKAGSELFKNYHAAAPFAKETMDAAAAEVHEHGFVTTVLGRKSDFPFWGPVRYEENSPSLSYEAARSKWGEYGIKRAYTHKALNRKLQGGAADVMKKAMVDAYEAGYFADDACGMPMLTVHDELDFEDCNDPDAPIWAEFKHVMENALPLSLPIRMDASRGPNWGDAD